MTESLYKEIAEQGSKSCKPTLRKHSVDNQIAALIGRAYGLAEKLHTADGITDQPVEVDEATELIVEINDLNAEIFTLKEFPGRVKKEVNERYEEATRKRRDAESKIEDWENESANDANLAYWEGQCHALSAIKRAMVI